MSWLQTLELLPNQEQKVWFDVKWFRKSATHHTNSFFLVVFLEQIKASQDNNMLIGQFGVGFYSVFLVADKVTVISKHNNDTQSVWQCDTRGEFYVSEDPRGNTLGRGTQLVLQMKEDAWDFLEEDALRGLVKKYSEFITFPIYLYTSHEEEKEVPMTPEEIKEEEEKEGKDTKKEEEEEKVSLDEEKEEQEEQKEEKEGKRKHMFFFLWNAMF